ncbi:MAG: phosphoserine transaminase [Actinomycetota bacterium]|jgi:phosphoserine aminotransferase|nr:phosphoserine transaminase [Actinomycetota bacterium]
MTDAPDIRIPAGLLPADGRFGSGPSKVPATAVAALAGAPLGTNHRQAPVRDLVRRLRAGLRELWALPDGHEVVLGNGGASQFWDVACACLAERRTEHLVFGEFSAKFASAAARAPHLDDPVVVGAEAGAAPPSPSARADVDLYALTHNETSTGVCAPVERPASDGLVAVDATSGAGALPWDPAAVDAYYFAPQKVFAADGGLWVAVCSPAALGRAGRLRDAAGRWVPASLDLTLAAESSRLDQTVNTPSVSTLVLFVAQLEWLLANGGAAFAAARSRASAAVLYGWAERSDFAAPFVADATYRSPVVGTVDLDPAVPAATVTAVLRSNGIVDTEAYRKLGRNQLRVGMFPAVDAEDVRALTSCIDHVVGRLV